MHSRIFLVFAFFFLNCGCGKKLVGGETIQDQPVTKPILIGRPINPCTRAVCPLTGCFNSLPPIPSQGICCSRCVKNPDCKVNACPKLDCPKKIIPANLDAGECCDRCPEEKLNPDISIDHSSSDSSYASSRSSESSSSGSSSSSEHSFGCGGGCPIRRFINRDKNARLVRILRKKLAQCRRMHHKRRANLDHH